MTLPVVIVGGLHADARRGAVRELLAAVPGSVALHHDLATAAESPYGAWCATPRANCPGARPRS